MNDQEVPSNQALQEQLGRIENKLAELSSDKSGFKWLAETFLVPITIALLSAFVALASNRIAEAELESAEKQAETNKLLGYLEIFYSEIGNPEQPKRQISALQILYQIDPAVGRVLANAVRNNPENSTEVRFAAAQVGAALSASVARERLSGFRIVIYYPKWRPHRQGEANRLHEGLVKLQIRRVELRGADSSFYTRNRTPSGYEVRYERGREDEGAQALKSLLEFVQPTATFALVPVVPGATSDAITVFLPIK